MRPIVIRWLRAIFGTSAESLRDIRRRDPANMRHLAAIDPDVLARWSAGAASASCTRPQPPRARAPACGTTPAR